MNPKSIAPMRGMTGIASATPLCESNRPGRFKRRLR